MRSKALLLLSAVAFAACRSNDASNSATGGTFIVVNAGDVADIFSPYVSEQYGNAVQLMVYDRLADISPDMNTVGDKGFIPRLAKSWTWAPDSLSIAFSLDPRAKWHDGKPVTAADVKYSFKVYTDPKAGSPVAPTLANVDSVSVKDSLTPVVWFKRRTPEQFYDVTYQLLPVPEHVYGAVPLEQLRTSPVIRNIVGSGRFKVAKWEPKVRIELVADTANYRGRPGFDRVIIIPVPDANSGATQVLTGQADFQEAFPLAQAGTLDSSKIARPLFIPTAGYAYLGFNRYDGKTKNPHPIFADIRVRRALAMAVDREAMLKNVYGDKGRLSHGPFPATVSFADTTLKLPPYDTTAAKALLDSAGWRLGADGVRAHNGKPLEFSLIAPTSSLFRRRYAVLLQEAFRKIGVKADVDIIEPLTFQARMAEGSFDAGINAFNTDPSISGSKQSWSTSAIGPSGQNTLKYSNKTVDALLDTAAAAFDPAKSRAAASRAFQTIVNDVPAIFLYDVVTVDAVHRRINVGPMRPDSWAANLGDWTVSPDKRIDRDRIGLAQPKP